MTLTKFIYWNGPDLLTEMDMNYSSLPFSNNSLISISFSFATDRVMCECIWRFDFLEDDSKLINSPVFSMFGNCSILLSKFFPVPNCDEKIIHVIQSAMKPGKTIHSLYYQAKKLNLKCCKSLRVTPIPTDILCANRDVECILLNSSSSAVQKWPSKYE